MLTRREFAEKVATDTGKIAAATAILWAAAATAKETTSPAGGSTAPPRGKTDPRETQHHDHQDARSHSGEDAPPWQLLHPLQAGASVSHGWTLADLSAAASGSCVVTLQNAHGRSHRVHLCRNDGDPRGVIHTSRFDLVVMNGGRGDLPTDESFGQALASLAHVVAANEHRREHAAVLASLQPHTERLRSCSGPSDSRLR